MMSKTVRATVSYATGCKASVYKVCCRRGVEECKSPLLSWQSMQFRSSSCGQGHFLENTAVICVKLSQPYRSQP